VKEPWAEKYLWLDTETTGLDVQLANILELAYIPEVNGVRHNTRELFVQPIIHFTDMVHGHIDIRQFVDEYNQRRQLSPDNELAYFSLDGGEPLFTYTKSALSCGLPAGRAKNPAELVLDPKREFPDVVLQKFIDDLNSFPEKGRWTLIGYNVKFDYDVLTNWIKRIVGKAAAKEILNNFSFLVLDVLSLTRWFSFAGKLKTENHKLTTIASTLQLAGFDAHTAKADIEETHSVAKVLMNHLQDVTNGKD
jgi:DNA polymerase III epsilon subunit-like protein